MLCLLDSLFINCCFFNRKSKSIEGMMAQSMATVTVRPWEFVDLESGSCLCWLRNRAAHGEALFWHVCESSWAYSRTLRVRPPLNCCQPKVEFVVVSQCQHHDAMSLRLREATQGWNISDCQAQAVHVKPHQVHIAKHTHHPFWSWKTTVVSKSCNLSSTYDITDF